MFVRPSKFRHVYGTPTKREQCYDNLRISTNAWDTNLAKVNPRFLSVNWQSSGGGTFAVIPLEENGKLRDDYPLYKGHTAPVLDTDFNPFNDYVVASGSEDTTVMIWNIPEEYAEELEEVSPVSKLTGHGRKVGHVLFHPTADNILASASTDMTVKLWDIEKGKERQQLDGHTESIQSLAWNYNGSLLATTCRDKKIRIFDARSNKIVQEGPGHQGIKASRVAWLGDKDRIVVTGFSKLSDRQCGLWDSNNLEKPIENMNLDQSSGIIMPFFDADTSILYLAGKGDGNIRYYEYTDDKFHDLSEFKSSDSQRGMAFLPKRAVNVSQCEIARLYKVGTVLIEPIPFTVPRKSDAFQADLYPKTIAGTAALTADEWFSGKDADPLTIDLEEGFVPPEKKEFNPTAQEVPSKTASPENDEKDFKERYGELSKEHEILKNNLSQKDDKIRSLETAMEKLKTDVAQKENEAAHERETEIESLKKSLSEKDESIRGLETKLETLRAQMAEKSKIEENADLHDGLSGLQSTTEPSDSTKNEEKAHQKEVSE